MPISTYLRRLREKVGTDVVFTLGAGAVIMDDAGRVLLQKRSDNRQWSLPGGGLEPLETPADAVVREVWEETGLLVEPVRVMGVFGGPEFHVTYPNGDEISGVTIVFACRPIGGSLRPDGDEVLDLAYFDMQEALARLSMPDRLRSRFQAVMAAGERAYFDPPTWQPPTDGIRANGISPYMRRMREKVGTALLMTAGAAAVIFNEQGHVLLQKRGDTGRWGLVGGGIDPDEAPADAVVREAWEETGLLVEPVRIIGVYGGPDFHLVYPNGDEVAITSIAFECRVVGGTLTADGEESLALAYFPPEDVLDDTAIPARMRLRIRHALERHDRAYFDPPTWQPQQ